jgi:hypothetical protein
MSPTVFVLLKRVGKNDPEVFFDDCSRAIEPRRYTPPDSRTAVVENFCPVTIGAFST